MAFLCPLLFNSFICVMNRKKIVAFGASSSKKSINKRLANFAAHKIKLGEVTLLDLNDFEMPIYSIDKENEGGIPELAHKFKSHINNTDGIVISFAEHNGAYSAAFKNIYDWISRIEKSVWADKPMFLMATSPGGRGGETVLQIANDKFKRSNSVVTFSLPSFNQNFNELDGITNAESLAQFNIQLALFEKAL